MMAKNNILDTIECSTIGWQDKPQKMPRLARPLDADEYGQGDPSFSLGRPDAFGSVKSGILAVLHHVAPDGGWVLREVLASRVQTNEKNLTESISDLVREGKIQRSHAKGARMCYRLAHDTPAPERVPLDSLRESVLRVVGPEWVTTAGYAERLRHSTERITATMRALIADGLVESRRGLAICTKKSRKQSGNTNTLEYRASPKLLVSRLGGSARRA